MTDWFYEQAGNRHGPVSREEIKTLHSDGGLSDSSLVWHAEFGRSWRPLRDAAICDEVGPPPLPVTHVSNVYAWLGALVPLIGAGAERVLQDVAPAVTPTGPLLFVIYTAAYVLLCSLDGRMIKRSGRARDVALLGWVWFVPVYLIQRARALGTRYYLVAVWVLALLGSVVITAPDILTGKAYLGFGIPGCDATTSQRQVTEIFDDVPAVKQAGARALKLSGIAETGKTNTVRSCKATVEISSTRGIPVSYTITQQKDDFYYEVQVGG